MRQKKGSHYEVLGVEPDASPEEIKRAYRKKATSAHPDKKRGGAGDNEEMIELNAAYECLSDPGRRQLYDATGRDQAKPFEHDVRDLLFSAFTDALLKEAPDTLAHARAFVEERRAKIATIKRNAEAARARFTAKRGKVSVSEGTNLFHVLINKQLEMISQDLAGLEADDERHRAALDELKKYSTTERPPGFLPLPPRTWTFDLSRRNETE